MDVAHFAYSVLKIPSPHGPITIYDDQKGAVAYDMKTLDLIKQFKLVLADLAEPPSKQQKAANSTIMTTPATTLPVPVVIMSLLEATTKQPILESSKAAEAKLKALALLET
jgi:hypothetical protein